MENKLFCDRVLKLIGLPYTECDCIGVVRRAAQIRCQGTNWLWRSYNNSGKYKYLTQRMDRPPTMNELTDGLLVFRIKWNEIPRDYNDRPNCHHVGIIIGRDVVQSQESKGVYKKPYSVNEWDGCGWLKQVDIPKKISNMDEYESQYIPDIGPDEIHPEDLEGENLTMYMMVKALYNKFIVD